MEQPRDCGLHGRTGVGHLSGQPFEQHKTQGLHVAERPSGFSGGLLRAQVRGGPGGPAVVGHRVAASHDGNTEVAELRPGAPVVVAVVHQQDVGRFHIAVHDAVVMDVGKSVGQIVADQRHVSRGQRPLGGSAAGVVRTLTERGLVIPAMAGAPAQAFVDSTPDLPDMNPGDTA